MSFSYKFETLRSGNSYDSRTQPRISAHGVDNTGEAEMGIIDGSEENSVGIQYESPYSEGPGSSKFPTVAPLTTPGYSPDIRLQTEILKPLGSSSESFGFECRSPVKIDKTFAAKHQL